jgi:hypothetical protein
METPSHTSSAAQPLVLSGIDRRHYRRSDQEFDSGRETKLVMTVRLFCALSLTVRIAVACLFVGVVLGIYLGSQFSSVPGS